MNIARFLSKFTFICNIAFLFYVLFCYMEMKRPTGASYKDLVPVPFIKAIIITLGYPAIFINIFMNAMYLGLLIARKLFIPRWLVLANVFFLIIEILYFSLNKSV